MGDVAGDIVPSRVDWIDLMARHAEAPGERRPGHQAVYAVAMKGATTRKAIARSARDAELADFWMHGPGHGLAVAIGNAALTDGAVAEVLVWGGDVSFRKQQDKVH